MRVVVVEDNVRLGRLILEAFERAGIAADVFESINDALYAVSRHDYSAMVLDRGLPDGDGIGLIRQLRKASNDIPCLILTARDAIHDRIDGLDAGADDYLVKPFAIDELLARVRALLRRQPVRTRLQYEIGDLVVNAAAATAMVAEKPVHLSATEFRLLLILAEQGGDAVTREFLLDALAGPFSDITPGSLDVSIHRLRRRLAMAGTSTTVINIRGLGYALRSS